VEGVKEAVAKGVFTAGDKMPSVRELAAKITINPNTIAKAYQEMEREGLIETLRGRGTYVAAREAQVSQAEKKRIISEMLEKMLVEAFYLQIDEEEMIGLMNEAVREWYRERRGK
jgi:GntR family transcriptional regulator